MDDSEQPGQPGASPPNGEWFSLFEPYIHAAQTAAKQWQDMISFTSAAVDRTGRDIETILDGTDRFARMMQQTHDMAISWAAGINEYVAQTQRLMSLAARQALETTGPFLEAMIRYAYAVQAVQGTLLPRGWLISPEFPAGLWTWLHSELQSKTIEHVEAALVDLVNHEVRVIIEATYDHPAFDCRRHLFEGAGES